MSLPPLPLIDGCIFLDNTTLELLTTCPRALEYNRLWKRISAADKPSLNFGSAIHLALEYRYKACANQSPDIFFAENVAQLLSKHFDEHPCPMDDWRNLNWAIELVKRYNERYDIEPWSLLKYDQPMKCTYCDGVGFNCEGTTDSQIYEKDFKRIPCLLCNGTGQNSMMVELPFALPLFNFKLDANFPRPDYSPNSASDQISVIYTGRIDLPIMWEGNLYVMDHKTTGMLGQPFWDGMKRSAQLKGYSWAFNQLTGKTVHGYVCNAIRTKEPPQYVTSGKESRFGKRQTPESWWAESLQRERYLLQPGELDEWKNNTIALVEEFFWHYSRDYMPMKTKWCQAYGRCPYFDVCCLPKDDRGLMLASGLFTSNNWSPLITPKTQTQNTNEII